MSQYYALDKSSLTHPWKPWKAVAGVVGVACVLTASWVARRLAFSSTTSSSDAPFAPKGGLQQVVSRPGPPGQLQLLAAARPHTPCYALFLYSATVPKELTGAEVQQEARVYGARLMTVQHRAAPIALPTASAEDVLHGHLLCWPSSAFQEKLEVADRLMGYEAHQQPYGIERGVVRAVQLDGHETNAHWYFQGAPPRTESNPRLRFKANEFLADFLLKEKLLGSSRASDVLVKQYVPGKPTTSQQKIVHLVRHGQGFHNLLKQVYREHKIKGQEHVQRPELLDTPLTALGRDEAKSLQKQTSGLSQLQLIVTSPLSRAVQTAQLAFSPLLQAKKAPALVAHQLLTEQSGVEACNRRRPLSELRQDFPTVDWSQLSNAGEDDPYWTAEHFESGQSMSDRVYGFLRWLRARPETEVALVAHCGILFTLLNTAVQVESPELAEWFATGSLRTVVMDFK